MHSRIIKLRLQQHFNNPGLASFSCSIPFDISLSESSLRARKIVESRTQSLPEQNVLGIVFIVYVHCIWYDLLAVLGMIRWKINCQGEGTIIRDFPFWSPNSFRRSIIVWILLSNAAQRYGCRRKVIKATVENIISEDGTCSIQVYEPYRMYDPVRGNKKSFAPLWEDAIKATWAESWDERQRFSIKLINFYDPKASHRTAARIELERKSGKALVIIDNLFFAPTSPAHILSVAFTRLIASSPNGNCWYFTEATVAHSCISEWQISFEGRLQAMTREEL